MLMQQGLQRVERLGQPNFRLFCIRKNGCIPVVPCWRPMQGSYYDQGWGANGKSIRRVYSQTGYACFVRPAQPATLLLATLALAGASGAQNQKRSYVIAFLKSKAGEERSYVIAFQRRGKIPGAKRLAQSVAFPKITFPLNHQNIMKIDSIRWKF